MSEPETYARAAGIVWRLGPAGVILRVVGRSVVDCRDLSGSAAAVWVALDEPATVGELRSRLDEARIDSDDVPTALAALVDAGLVVRC